MLEERNVRRGLSAAELAKLKVRGVVKADLAHTCHICLDMFDYGDEVMEMAGCRHQYHSCCISKWLALKRNCPTCRTEC